MYYAYVLRSTKFPKQLYKGSTSDLKERMAEHNRGGGYTNRYRPWKLAFYAAFEEKKKALEFEKYLKSASGIAFMKKRLLS